MEESNVETNPYQLHLDTKETCFLCLQEHSSSVLNTNNTTDNINDEIDKKNGEFCIKNICRYIKIHPYSIILKSMKTCNLLKTEQEDVNSTSSSLLSEKCDFSVRLCANCKFLTKNISDLISQMEMIKILITHQLQVFHQILNDSELESKAHLDVADETTTEDNIQSNRFGFAETCLLETLRHEMITKCFAKIKILLATSLPKVRIKLLNFTEDNKTEVQNELKVVSNVSENGVESKDDNVELVSSSENEIEIVSETFSNVPTSSSENDTPSSKGQQFAMEVYAKYIKQVQPENRYQCFICRQIFSQGSTGIRSHLVNCHPEVMFASKRPDHVSEDDFRDYCKHVINAEVNHARTVVSTPNSKNEFFCEMCNRKYTRREYFRYHLLLEHYQTIEEKLIRNISIGVKKPSFTKWPCSLQDGGRGRFFTSKCSLNRHRKNHCLNRSVIGIWTCHVDECKRDFVSEYCLKRHQKKKHLETEMDVCQGIPEQEVMTTGEHLIVSDEVMIESSQSANAHCSFSMEDRYNTGINYSLRNCSENEILSFEGEQQIVNRSVIFPGIINVQSLSDGNIILPCLRDDTVNSLNEFSIENNSTESESHLLVERLFQSD